ncbi:TPA: hypothetical protein N0F65_006261 [Lagenidium giganteum]|uniref:Mevalonate kinase n=1 Tax=Lagenidium giganteum TaxID=4803 RepID=A0AAV2Z5N2_9STRA|nr:TPA: hypothetical protein N0F65_006261 [Lagenidium giganteum]
MTTTFEVSAPAKALLFGEHAVVYGCTCIAAALSDIRMCVRITSQPATPCGPAIQIVYHDIASTKDAQPLNRTYQLDALKKVVQDLSDDKHFMPAPSAELLNRLDRLLELETPEDAKTLRPALYLSCALLRHTVLKDRCEQDTQSLLIETFAGTFPIGAGLGSSAAFAVALSGALCGFQHPDQPLELERINRHAFAAEILLHGSPSGVDNTIATFGGILKFQKLPVPTFNPLTFDLSKRRFMLINTRIPRSTKVQVGNVRSLYDAAPAETEAKFHRIEDIATSFIGLGEQSELSVEKLGALLEENHAILNSLNVGHERLEAVAEICKRYGAYTKLTGAGGGGCAITLLPDDLPAEQLERLSYELVASECVVYVTALGGDGVVKRV